MDDIKQKLHEAIDGLDDTIGCAILIGNDFNRQTAIIGGIPDMIIDTLASIMKQQHQVKDLIEAAWCKCNETNPMDLN